MELIRGSDRAAARNLYNLVFKKYRASVRTEIEKMEGVMCDIRK